MTVIRLLAVDVGSGTQDLLLYEDGIAYENMIKMVLPSRTKQVAEEIKQATLNGDNIYLDGNLMGGGASSRAIKEHLRAGLKVAAHPFPAKTIKDDLGKVKELGIEVRSDAPPEFCIINMGDLDLDALRQIFDLLHISLPAKFAIAVQDHGDSGTAESNRRFRFKHWQSFLHKGGFLEDLVYTDPPSYFTRMLAIKKLLPRALLMDTGAAAVLGSFEDPYVREKGQEGVVLVNIGNQHTFAALVKKGRVNGIFEHHTSMLDTGKLQYYLDAFQKGWLTNEEVFADHGHGCKIVDKNNEYIYVAVTGPQRELAEGLKYHFVNPHGDMMLTGCFGLVRAFKLKNP